MPAPGARNRHHGVQLRILTLRDFGQEDFVDKRLVRAAGTVPGSAHADRFKTQRFEALPDRGAQCAIHKSVRFLGPNLNPGVGAKVANTDLQKTLRAEKRFSLFHLQQFRLRDG